LVRRHILLLATILTCCSSGCAIGPHTVRSASLGYNEVLHSTAEAELLLNLVRARYGEQPVMVEVASVTQQYGFTSQATFQGLFGSHVFPLGLYFPNWLVGGTASETPTIVLAPKFDDTFNQRMRAPISIDSMSILVWCGWNIDTILRVASNNINGLDNALLAGRPNPEWPADVQEFRQVTQLLRQLQLRGKVELVALFAEKEEKESSAKDKGEKESSAKDKGEKESSAKGKGEKESSAKDKGEKDKRVENLTHVLRFAPEIVGTSEHQALMKLLKLRKAERFYKVNAAAEGVLKEQPPFDELVLSRRSFSEVLFFMSQGTEVPSEHIMQCIAHQTVASDGQAFDWNTVIGDMIRVRSQKQKPKHAEVSVQYRDYWFYIDESDLASRYSFNLLVELYNMEVRGGGGASVPLITIGAGGK
jgi:hypothetical protein